MDNDDFRRGRPSCHRKFGEAVAILAGDALLTYAFEVLSTKDNFRSLKEGEIIRIIRTLAFLAGSGGMVGGQVLDIGGTSELEEINRLKTAALFKAVFLCAGIISRVEEKRMEILEQAGEKLGLLFQVTDDIIDRDGYYHQIGEEASRDLARRLKDEFMTLAEGSIGSLTEELRILIDRVYERIIT